MTLKRMLAFVVAMAMVMGIVPAMAVTAANDDAAAVAVVANEEYDTLQDAIAAAEAAYDNDGAMATVTLLDSTDEDFTLEYGIVKLVTDGFKYTGTATVTGAVLMSDCYLTNVEAELTGVSSDKSMFGYTSMDTGVEVVEGAQVRIGDGADEDGMVTDSNGGLRFIATTKMIDTLAAMAYELYNTESGEYAEGYELGIRLMAESSSSEVFVPATLWQQEGKVFTAALTNLKESNYNRRYTANAYVVIEGVRFDDKATSTRSIYQVSAGLLAQNAEQSAMSQDLVDVLNAYVNQTGVRLVLSDFTTEATLTAATGNVNGAYTGEAVFKVGSTTYKNGVYTVVLEAIGRSVINTKLFNQYVRINNNNSKVAPLTTITDNGNGTYTITFDYADMNKTAGVITEPVTLENGEIVAYIPAGVTFNGSATRLKLLLTTIDDEQSEVEAEEGEELDAFDIHVSGIDENNTTPIIITLPEVAEKGLNRGNLKLYHVEDGKQVMMEQVDSVEMLTKHNQFTYDPLDGTVTVALASFSEVALVSTEAKWEGNYDYSWYDASKTELTIANADQLAAFGQIVGGMTKDIAQDSFDGKTVKLVSDINLADDEENNEADKIFYPIGYYNSTGSYEKKDQVSVTSDINPFEGTFDGNGHTIKNIYQNTWEMFGDYNSGYSGTPNHYDDGMGLFGYVVDGTVKNLTVDNFSSDGEFTPTGVIAAYAVNSTFENIALTNCNPRVYNTGNGGIVGIGGNSDDPDAYRLTFTNITIDNTNKISALWGSWDVACGGLVGMFRGAGHAYMTNCHVAAQMDVYNDVCGNYQYYWYRYAGMMIGTNKTMVTDENGYTVPETEKFHAKDCTVHFGEWNDYYYCELVANSLASYTHDHQFSRLEQVKDVKGTTITYLDGTTGAVPTSGRFNYVVETVEGEPSTVNASCYHFVDGDVWNHEQGGYETTDINGDGVVDSNVLKEDKQHVYLPFNQLFTGYGWGVKHIPVYNGEDYAFEGITILDREVADSVEKFDAVIEENTELQADRTIKVGKLFKKIENLDEKVAIQDANVQITVSPANETSTAGVIYVANADDWTQGTLVFSGEGTATITITDYYFCTPTTITVEVTKPEETEKFAHVFPNTDKYLYRVGNDATTPVALSSLFVETGIYEAVGDTVVTVEAVDGTGASGTYNPNNKNIAFSGTGIVEIIVKDDDKYCKPTVLYLEVVDAKNITSAEAGTNKKFVLLKDVDFSSTYLYYKNSTLYGNGFTIDITDADHSDLKDSSDTSSNKSAYCNIWMVDSTFDNVKILGSVYPEVGMTADSDYGNAAVRVEGNSIISNSYISNCRVPLRVQGNLTLENTVIDGGRYANIELRQGKLVLDNVTTINTLRKGSDGTTDVIGFGIVVHADAPSGNTWITVKDGGLKQYNWVGEKTHKSVLSSDFYLNEAYKLIFSQDNDETIYFSQGVDRFVNTGILCLCADLNADIVSGLDEDRHKQTVSGYDAWVLTYDNTKHTEWFNESVDITTVEFEPKQGSVIPTYSGNDAQTIEFIKGEPYYFDTSVLTAEKFGQTLEILSVVMDGTTYKYGDKIAITEGGVFEVVYTVVDPYNYSANANPYEEKHTETITVTAIAKDAEILAPKFTFIDQNGNKYESTTVKAGDKTYVMPNVTAADPTTNGMSSINIGSATISGTTVYFPVATGYTVRSGSNFNRYYPLFNGINITDYTIAGDTTGTTYTTSGNYTSLVGSSGTKFIIPVNGGQTNCGDYVKTDGQAGNAAGNSDSGWQGAGYSTSYGGTYLKSGNTNASSGADSNGYERIVWVEYSFNAGNGDVYYYRIGYHCNKEAAQTGCFTPDTLITLADGSQKEIQDITAEEQILAWDMFTGEYAAKDIAILVNHGEDLYEVTHLTFSDGAELKLIADHGVFDYDLNKFVYITADNYEDYIGHRFVKQNLNGGYDVVTLESGYVTEEVTSAYSITSAGTSNAFAEGMLTVAPPADFYNWIEMGDKLRYDVEQFNADVEKYGLYTYEDFKDYVTYEQFIDWNGAYLKVPVEKGIFTFEYILELIELYKGYMPE